MSGTFHGRDVFAPAAAHLSCGVLPAELGPVVTDPVRLDGLAPVIRANTMTGQIIRFDHFGNAITNIPFDVFSRFVSGALYRIEAGDLAFDGVGRSYHEGEFTCLVGSSGYLEFGFFKGNLAAEKGWLKGDAVVVRRSIG